MEEKFKSILYRSEVINIAGVLLILTIFFILGSLIDLSFINQYIEASGVWAPILFILAKISTIVFAPLSGTALYILAGPLFGMVNGIIYVILADFIGFSILFYLSRKYGLKIIIKIIGKGNSAIIESIIYRLNNIRNFVITAAVFWWFPEGVIAASGLSNLEYKKVIIIFMSVYSIITSLIILISYHVLV